MRVMSRVPRRSLKLDFDIAILMTCREQKILKTEACSAREDGLS